MNCIVYSLFGYERARQDNCFDFNSYLRGLMINIRMTRLLYPGWRINLQTDKATYEKWGELFNKLNLEIEVHQNGVPLTLAMLWRLRPVFDLIPAGEENHGFPKYEHVICRDLDSPPTYREVQAVKYWIDRDKAAHAINDSVSHTIPMLGGMVGFRPRYFRDMVGVNSWAELINKGPQEWEKKGSDQTFLNSVVYPCFAQNGRDSIVQHAFKGLPNTFLTEYRTCQCDSVKGHESYCPNNIETGLDYSLSESNNVCGHIGSSGYYNTAMTKFLEKHKDSFEDLIEIEKQWPDIFSWVKNGCY